MILTTQCKPMSIKIKLLQTVDMIQKRYANRRKHSFLSTNKIFLYANT